MKPPADGWDQDEREVLELEGLNSQLEKVRARHALRPEDEARLLTEIQKASYMRWLQHRVRWRDRVLAIAAAAAFLIAGTLWLSRIDDTADESKAPEAPTAAATPPPAFRLPLDKPDIKVSPSSLAWRGPGGENTLLADLKPAFDAFRGDDYARADREFSALSARYPQSVEITLYQGVARLFIGNIPGAIESLGTAEGLADRSLAWDVSWYRAVAEERAGNREAARARLTDLCAQPDPRAKSACGALSRLTGG